MGWQNLKNGKLLAQAAPQFDVLLRVDKNIRFQQNLATLPISVIDLDVPANTPKAIQPLMPVVLAVLPSLGKGQLVVIDHAGNVVYLTVSPPV